MKAYIQGRTNNETIFIVPSSITPREEEENLLHTCGNTEQELIKLKKYKKAGKKYLIAFNNFKGAYVADPTEFVEAHADLVSKKPKNNNLLKDVYEKRTHFELTIGKKDALIKSLQFNRSEQNRLIIFVLAFLTFDKYIVNAVISD